MSTASTRWRYSRADASVTGVRSATTDALLAPVFFGDTITVSYTVASIDREKLRATRYQITNQDGVLAQSPRIC